MADIQYLNYGDQQIEQQALLNNLANNVQNYVQNQSWSTKRKEKFMSAYSDLMNRGITGASNNTGQWTINVNGDPLPEMSKKDKEMYQEAAYFIQQQMASLPTKQAEEEKKEEEKAKLDIFNNQYFTTGFNTRLANDWFGGASFSRADDWNTLDERGENGLRGFKNRADRLAQSLQNYVDSLDESKLNFEGSAFKNLDDFKTKVGTAIQMLRTDPANAKDALNAIGLKFSDYLYNGAEDVSRYQDKEGNPLTYQQVADIQQKTQEEADVLKAQEAAAVQQQQANANKGILNQIGGIHGTDARNNPQGYSEYISNKLGVGQQGFNAMNSLVQGLLDKAYSGGGLNSDEKKQLGNLLYYIRQNNPNYQGLGTGKQTNVTLEEFEELKKFQSFGENNIKNMVRLPWQTSNGRYTYADSKGNVYFLKPTNQKKFNAPAINRSRQYYNYKNNFLSNTSAGNKIAQQNYLNQEGAENAEIGAIVADIASIVDPEPFSAMGLALGAAGARNYAKLQQPEKWSFTDYASQGLDYLTGVIGAIPVVGDATLATKVIKNLRRLSRFGAWSDIVQSTPGLKNIWDKKIMGDEKLTKQDWRIIGTALRGIVSHGRLNQSNLAARTVMKQRGLETGNAWHQRSGFTSSAKSTNKTDVLKVTKNGKSEEIEITAKQKQDLKEAFKKTKPSERTTKAKEILGNDKIPEGAEVKVSDGVRSTLRNWNRFTRRTSDSFGTKSTPVTRENIKSNKEFENFLQRRSTLNKIGLGSNRYLRRIDRQLNLNSNSIKPQNNLEIPTGSSKSSVNIPKGKLTKEQVSELRETLKGKKFGTAEFQDANFDIKNLGNIQFTTAKDGTRELKLTLKDGTILSQKSSYLDNTKLENLRFIKNNLRKIAEQLPKNQKSKINFELIKQLKKVGALKQGGTIDKQRIQQYKEYITK